MSLPTHTITSTPSTPHRPSPGRGSRRRRGSIYLPVLFVGSIVAALSIGGLVAVRSTGRVMQLRTDAAEARLLARAGVDAARGIIASDPNWRTNRSNGNWLSNISLPGSGGTFTVNVTNPLGTLSNSTTDPVTITATARVRSATQTLTCTFGPVDSTPVTSLRASAAAMTAVVVNSATISGTNQRISTNGLLTASLVGCSVSVPVETGLASTGLIGFSGGTTLLAAPRTYPDLTVFDWYSTEGATISYTQLPSGNSGRILNRVLLSPGSNPYGSTDTNGVYVINCAGGNLTIQDCRLVGTLVVLNAGTVTVQNSVAWSPASSGLPALLVQGNLVLATSSAALVESSIGVNLNPSSTPVPYPSGTTNTAQTESYASQIDGLVFATGNITCSNAVAVHSLMARGTLTVSGTLTLRSDGRYAAAAPPGFTTTLNGVQANSFR